MQPKPSAWLPVAVTNVQAPYPGSGDTLASELALGLACFLLGIAGAIASIYMLRVIRSWRQAGERERIRADKAIKVAERRYQNLFENAVEGIFQTSPEGEYLNVNSALARIYGYDSPSELISSLTDIARQLYVDHSARAEFRRIMDEHDTVSGFEAEIYRKDGKKVWIREHARAVRDEDGEIVYYEGTVEDITVRKRAAAEIEKLNRNLELRLKRIAALRTIDLAISSSLDPRLSMNVVMDQACEQLGADAAVVLLHNPHSHELEFFAGKGTAHVRDIPSVRVGHGKLGEAALHLVPLEAQELTDSDPLARHTFSMARKGFTGYAGSPLIARGQLRGWLEVYSYHAFSADPEWAEYLDTLAGQAAIAVDSTKMFRDLQRHAMELSIAYDSTIEGWSKALSLRDEETSGHCERVTDLTLQIACAMGIAEAELLHIRRGALLHDIGKMAVPDAVLLKPGPLDAEERKIMDRHTTCAYEMLSSIPYLRPALDIPYCHHEKWDGTGYPRGLKGEDIPLAARIFAIVDVWDALTSDRPYRKAWSGAKAYEHIRGLSGSHFAPQVVEVFLEILKNRMCDEETTDGRDNLPMAA